MLRITEVVKHLIIINVLMYILPLLTWGEQGRGFLALHYPFFEGGGSFQPFQIVTHLFMHGDLTHLFFNMFTLFMLGPYLESYWGSKKFLGFYLATGIGAAVISVIADYVGFTQFGIVPYASWGASGAVYGVLAGAGMTFPNNQISLLFPPITLKFKVLVPILIAMELYLGFSGANTGIAHFAHLGGALVGALIVLYWRKFDGRW